MNITSHASRWHTLTRATFTAVVFLVLLASACSQSVGALFTCRLSKYHLLDSYAVNMFPLRTTFALVASSLSAVNALYVNGSVTAPCDSPLYCQGPALKEIQLASVFKDSKTFVDMPTKKPLDEVLAAFEKLEKPLSNNTALNDFLSEYFNPAGGELTHVPKDQLNADPKFLNKINDTVIKEFTEKVIAIWPELTRSFQESNCSTCHNSFIPVSREFVVAGGRFREPYYWDTFWIIEGLLRSGGAFTKLAKNAIENFLDLVDEIGFVPNGARIYYLNRSQPPLLSQMLRIYVEYTNDTSLLPRAVPLLIKEHDWWVNNRSVEVITPDGKNYTLQRYAVVNNQPRPESFREDYITANNLSYYSHNGTVFPSRGNLTEEEKASLYANLASGAESGIDYSIRWTESPNDAARDDYFPLRSLDVYNLLPVDLNSILSWNEKAIADFLRQLNRTWEASEWDQRKSERDEAMFDIFWNSTHGSYFDFNLTSQSQHIYVPTTADALPIDKEGAPEGEQVLFSVSQLYPFWTGAAPESLKNNPCAVKDAFKRVAVYLDVHQGGIPASNFRSGQQWDMPSVWPPLMSVLMEGLKAVPATFGKEDPHYKEVNELALKLAQRYLDSTFCTWYATGGSTSQTPKLEGLPEDRHGIMFEKYDSNSTNRAGGGGEYEVVEGFGWTNGVLIWIVDKFGNELKRPNCGNITAAKTKEAKRSMGQSPVELHPHDARWIKN